jgi:cysteinyl-tRNA synthetase
MFCYTAHYRSPLAFSFEGALSAEQGLANLKKFISSIDKSLDIDGNGVDKGRVNDALEPFMEALCDDLNMPRAVAALWEGLRGGKLPDAEKLSFVREADRVLGLDLLKAAPDGGTEVTEEYDGYRITLAASGALPAPLKDAIIEKAALRKKSRAEKDFKTADLLRAQFAEAGVTVKDMPDGSTRCAVEDVGKAKALCKKYGETPL